MHAFVTWMESLGWRAALCFLFALFFGLIVAVLLIDAGLRKVRAWQYRRAIRERNWIARKQRVQLLLDAQREREQREADDATFLRRLNIDIANDESQRMRERSQFHISPAFRDMKGVQR